MLSLRQLLNCLLAALLCLQSFQTRAEYDDELNNELSDLKAAFIYNFARFTRWPDDDLQNMQELVICYDKQNAVASSLYHLEGKQLFGRKVVVAGVAEKGLKNCHVLYLADGSQELPGEIPENTLTISDRHHFIDMGGMIEIFIDDNRVRFNVNIRELQSNNLRVAARLLDLAETIRK
jgi:hypothetical protein